MIKWDGLIKKHSQGEIRVATLDVLNAEKRLSDFRARFPHEGHLGSQMSHLHDTSERLRRMLDENEG